MTSSFDPVVWINQHLTSLRNLEAVKNTVQTDISASTATLHAAVIAHSQSQPKALQKVDALRKDIRALFEEVSQVRTKSLAVESKVNALIGHVRHYDTAKINLSKTIDVVERVRAVELKIPDLFDALSEHNFQEVGRLLHELTGWFSALPLGSKEPPRVKQLREDVENFKKRCESEIETLMAVVVTDDMVTEISPALCQLADQLDVRQRLTRRFVITQSEAYMLAFPRGKEDATIARTERRFAWFRRWLRSFTVSGLVRLIPPTWNIPQEVAVDFCLKTRAQIEAQFQYEPNLAPALALRVVQKTLDFEKDLTERAKTPSMTPLDSTEDAPSPPVAVGAKYSYVGWISPCFEPAMESYAQLTSTHLQSCLTTLANDPTQWEATEEHVGALSPSASEVFLSIKEAYANLTAVCSGAPLLTLANIFDERLSDYALLLTSKIPSPPKTNAEMSSVCFLMNTAEMCSTTIQTLGEEVSNKVEALHRDRLTSFAKSSDAFGAAITKGMSAFIIGIQRRMLPAVNEMLSMNWGTFEANLEAMDEGRYVTSIRQALTESILVGQKTLTPTLFRFLCDKIAIMIVPKLVSVMYRMRGLSTQDACHQLRIDFGSLEKTFQTAVASSTASSSYVKIVKREFACATALLQVLLCDVGPTFLDVYCEFVAQADRSVTDFTKLLELKSASRALRTTLVEACRQRAIPETSPRDATREVAFEVGVSEDNKDITNSLKAKLREMKLPSFS